MPKNSTWYGEFTDYPGVAIADATGSHVDPSLGPKKYWSILNKFLQKKNIPVIPPLSENGTFVSDSAEKAGIFNHYFSSQCTPPPPPHPQPLETASVLPPLQSTTMHSLSDVLFNDETVLGLIRALNSNKSSGWDSISQRMIQMCDSSIVKPIRIIIIICFRSRIYPGQWYMVNVCPIRKKKSKNDKKNFRQPSLLPIFSKSFENIIF